MNEFTTGHREMFRSQDISEALKEEGYICLPLLNQAQVRSLRELYRSISPGGNDGFFTTMNIESVGERRHVDQEIKATVLSEVQALVPGYRPLLGNFTVKDPRGSSELRLHLDWSVVDERKHRAIGVWIPLQDVDENNGALGVLERSHRAGHSMRGSLINFVAFESSSGIDGWLRHLRDSYPAILLCLSAGMAVIYDLALGHFSPPNNSGKLRLACNLIMIPEESQPVHYYKSPEVGLVQLAVDEEFFVTRDMCAPIDLNRYRFVREEPSSQWKVEEQFGTDVEIRLEKIRTSRVPKATTPAAIKQAITSKKPETPNMLSRMVNRVIRRFVPLKSDSQNSSPKRYKQFHCKGIFYDPELQSEFDTRGFVCVPFFDENELESLREFYRDTYKEASADGFHTLINMECPEKRREVFERIAGFYQPKLEKLLNGYRPFVGSFVIKEPGETGRIPLHLDWSVVDETKAVAINNWVPLIDVDSSNGCLCVLEGSHRAGFTWRGSNVNNIASPDPGGPIMAGYVKNFSIRPLPLKAGTAIMYDHRIAHFSMPNLSEKSRPAVSLVAIPAGAEPVHYHFCEDGTIQQYHSSTEFYLFHRHGALPTQGLVPCEQIEEDVILRREDQVTSVRSLDREVHQLMARMKGR